ncbi:hypothetical protein LINPERHAP1_LOCUS34736 [Linum perenne]
MNFLFLTTLGAGGDFRIAGKQRWEAATSRLRRRRFRRVTVTSCGHVYDVTLSRLPTSSEILDARTNRGQAEENRKNCPFFKMDEDQDRIGDCTTNNFNGYDPIKEVTGQISVVVDDRRNWSSSTVNINFRWWKTSFLGRFQVRPISVWLFGLS